MPNDSSFNLTTLRISRLLRPLRTKCKTLSAILEKATKARSGVVTTYASSSLQQRVLPRWIDDSKSQNLVLMLPLEKSSYLSLDPTRAETELSSAIYDVRNAYQNVLHAATGISLDSRRRSPPTVEVPQSRVPSLGSICANIVGELIEDQAQPESGENVEIEEEEQEELERLQAIYDSMPPHYRRYALGSHALSIALGACPHNSSLLYLLLEMSVAYGLQPQTDALLRRFLEVAFEPPVSSTCPPIALIAYSYHLTALLELTCREGQKPRSVMNNLKFTRILLEVIRTTPVSSLADVWTCKAIRRFARRMLSNDFSAFMHIVAALMERTFRKRPYCGQDVATEDPFPQGTLVQRLSHWIGEACRHVHIITSKQGAPSEDLRDAIDLLVEAQKLELTEPKDPSTDSALADSLMCLATLILSLPASSLPGGHQLDAIVNLVVRAAPSPTTFDLLAELASSSASEGITDPLFVPLFSGALPVMRKWATTLRDRRCPLHEASLWSAALSRLEMLASQQNLSPRSPRSKGLRAGNNTPGLEKLRAELVDLVEDAERRSFGDSAVAEGGRYPPRTPGKSPVGTVGATRGAWRWEEVFDCWVQKTPASGLATATPATIRAPSMVSTSATYRKRLLDKDEDDDEPHTPKRRRRTYFAGDSDDDSLSLTPSPSRRRQLHRVASFFKEPPLPSPSFASPRRPSSLPETPTRRTTIVPTRKKKEEELFEDEASGDGETDEETDEDGDFDGYGDDDGRTTPDPIAISRRRTIEPSGMKNSRVAQSRGLDRRKSFPTLLADSLRHRETLHSRRDRRETRLPPIARAAVAKDSPPKHVEDRREVRKSRPPPPPQETKISTYVDDDEEDSSTDELDLFAYSSSD